MAISFSQLKYNAGKERNQKKREVFSGDFEELI